MFSKSAVTLIFLIAAKSLFNITEGNSLSVISYTFVSCFLDTAGHSGRFYSYILALAYNWISISNLK